MAVMRLEGWVWFLCLAVAFVRGDTEGEASNTDLISFPSSSPSRLKRSVCVPPVVTVTPSDDDLFWPVGEVRDVWCSVVDYNTGLTAHNLTISKGDYPLPHKVVNESTIHTTLNLTKPEAYTLFCGAGNMNCISQVRVGYKPLPVKDLQCVSHNWEYLTCNWTLQNNPISTEYQTYLVNSMDPEHKYECDCGDDLPNNGPRDECECNVCCLWSSGKYFAPSPEVVVMFAATNQLGKETFNHTLNNYAIVLPDPMSNVSVQAMAGQRAAVVRWTLPSAMGVFAANSPGVVVRVDHQLAEGEHTNWTLGEPIKCHAVNCKNGEHIISLEYWWTSFEVRVRLRSAAAPNSTEEDGWWSDWEPQYVKTLPAAPDTSPGVGPGTFQMWGDLGGDLTFTWAKVPQHFRNGPDFGYWTQVYDAGTRDVVQNKTSNNSFVVFHNLSSALNYTLQVAAKNSEGRGPWAKVNVYPDRPILPSLLPVVHAGAGQDAQYELRWKPMGEPNYTVYVCVGEYNANNCTGQLAWTSVGNASTVSLTLQDFELKDAESTQATFAVSAENAAGASSGMSWDRCGASQTYTTTRAPPTHIKALPSSSEVELQWDLACDYWAGVVEGAEAICCRGVHGYPNCTGGRTNKTQDLWTKTVVFKGLESGLHYTAWIKLHYRSGASTWSEGATFKTSTPAVEAWLVVVMVIVGILATVVISLGLLYSKRKFVDNLKKLRLQPSIPSGLVPVGRQEPRGSAGGEGFGGDVPVSQVSASVRNPSYSHILPTDFGRRPSLPTDEEENREASIGGNTLVVPPPHQRRTEADDNLLNTASERATDEGPEAPLASSGSTTEPLLQGSSSPHYVTPYFSESESEARDTSRSLFSNGYVSLPSASSGGSQASAAKTCSSPSSSGGYVPPSEGTKLAEKKAGYGATRHGDGIGTGNSGSSGTYVSPSEGSKLAERKIGYGSTQHGGDISAADSGSSSGYVSQSECIKFAEKKAASGYVTTLQGEDTGTTNPGYVQADAIPHPTGPPHVTDVSKSLGSTHWYVGLDFPGTNDPAPSNDPVNLTHDPVPRSQDSPAPHHDPGVPSPTPVPFHDDLKDTEPQELVEKPNYVSLPDAQLSMDFLRGDQSTPGDDELEKKESKSDGKVLCPSSDTPAPGYIAVQPPDFGKPAEEGMRRMSGDLGGKVHMQQPDVDSNHSIPMLFSKPDNASHGSPGYVMPSAFPAMTPDAFHVPNEAHKHGNLHLSSTTDVNGYVPFTPPTSVTSGDKKDSITCEDSWFSAFMPSSKTFSSAPPSQTPTTGISFVMLSNSPSTGDKSGEAEIKESELNGRSVEADENAENEAVENEAVENEDLALDRGYSRVGEPSE